jgi:cell wall integrity and stress response component
VGVVVGVIILAGLAGAGFLFVRRRQQKQMEEYKKQVDAPPFVGGTQPSSLDSRPSMWAPDNRLDGTTGGNRTSVGSIADNQDYSRKILQVSSSNFDLC